MIETVIAITIIAVMAGAFTTALYSTVRNSRDAAVLDQLDRIKKGIVGEPRRSPPGELNLIRYGYVGDMGSLPSSIAALEAAGTQPLFQVNTSLQIGLGWSGPYIPATLNNFAVDPWGQGLVYTVATGTNATIGATTLGTIRSTGPDLTNNTADDHVVEIYEAEVRTDLVGYVKDEFGGPIPGVVVKISYPTEGVMGSTSDTTDSNAFYSFDNVPHGLRPLELFPKLAYKRASGTTSGGGGRDVNFTVQNLGKDATTFTSMTVTYITSPATTFSKVIVDGTTVFSGTGASGSPVSFTRAVAGSGVIRDPISVDVANLAMQVPDAVVRTTSVGGSLAITLSGFQYAGTPAAPADMTGVSFSVSFSDGSQTTFVPIRQ